jgi:hypothetical protein
VSKQHAPACEKTYAGQRGGELAATVAVGAVLLGSYRLGRRRHALLPKSELDRLGLVERRAAAAVLDLVAAAEPVGEEDRVLSRLANLREQGIFGAANRGRVRSGAMPMSRLPIGASAFASRGARAARRASSR